MIRCRLMIGDAFAHMATLPDHSVDLIVTSPPFLALRSYLPADHPDKHLEIGSEPTPAAYLTTLLALTREWRRILAPHGSICVELGDTYSRHGASVVQPEHASERLRHHRSARSGRTCQSNRSAELGPGWPLAKSLCGIPTLYAWSLAYGHNLLNPDDTIEPWRITQPHRLAPPQPPVGALGDKVRPSTSYITVACIVGQTVVRLGRRTDGAASAFEDSAPHRQALAAEALRAARQGQRPAQRADGNACGVPRRWTVGSTATSGPSPPHPYKGAHYATYPPPYPDDSSDSCAPDKSVSSAGNRDGGLRASAEYVSTNGGRVVNQWAGERRGNAVNQWTVQGGNPGHAVSTASPPSAGPTAAMTTQGQPPHSPRPRPRPLRRHRNHPHSRC